MQKISFTENLEFNDHKIVTMVLLETSFSKEIRILLKEGQQMKEHKAPFPIIVHIVQGTIDFGVQGTLHQLKQGDIITLDANVPHDLFALSDSIVRLTLSKQDAAERVEKVVADS
ncbi:cupin domain-containing protein [Maribacter stanieri]|uniref:cupin domain-containing protein n=1 Tax=Maribacter stanieri TaxID=440514 RepID=UPI002494F8D4|nr:cupin domain-containing protein [Maribacter stanieri]